MRALLMLAGLAAIAAGPSALAQVWSLGGGASQRFEIDTNRALREDSDGVIFGSISDLDLVLGLETHRADWQLRTGARARAFAGPGDTENLTRIDPKFAFSGGYGDRRISASFNFDFDIRPVSFTEFDEEGDIDADGIARDADAIRTILSAGAGLTLTLDPRNTLSFSGSGRIERFSEGNDRLEPSSSANFGLSWNRRVSPRTSLSLSSSVQAFRADDLEDTRFLSGSVSAGVQRSVTRRLSFGGSAGVSVTRRSTDTFSPFGTLGRTTTTSVGGVGSLNLSYDLPRTAVVLSASQNVSPSSEGELQNRTAANFSVNHRIDRRQTVSFKSGVSLRLGIDGEETRDDGSTFFQLTPAYSYRMTQDWSANLSYRFRMRNDESGTGISNAVIFGITRDLAIFP